MCGMVSCFPDTIGATNGSRDMVPIKRLVSSRCTSAASRSMSSQITSSSTRAIRTKKKLGAKGYVSPPVSSAASTEPTALIPNHQLQRKTNRKVYSDFKEETCLRSVVSCSLTR